MQLAKSENLDLPTQVDAKHKADMDRLRGMNGTAFDTTYMQHMVQDHQKDVAELQETSQSGSDPGLKSFAMKYFACVAAASPDGSVDSTQRIVGQR
jgi:putative membrane protein